MRFGNPSLLRVLLGMLAAIAAPDLLSAANSAQDERAPGIANPAALYCGQRGGRLESVRRTVAGEDYGAYTACVFADNRRCEEWAMFRGACPVGGIRITGYDNDAQVYCAITGGTIDKYGKNCGYANGANCGLSELYSGRCRQQTVRTASGIHYRQYPEAGLAIGYIESRMTLVNSSGGILSAQNVHAQEDKPLRLIVDITKLTDLPKDGAPGFNSRDAAKERAALAAGSFGQYDIPAVRNSGKVVTVGAVKVKSFVTLSRLDGCGVTFERHARFYHADTMVTIILAADTERLIADNPGYFTVDAQDCATSSTWRRSEAGSSVDRFYAELLEEKVSRSALNWFYSFQTVIGALAVREPAAQ